MVSEKSWILFNQKSQVWKANLQSLYIAGTEFVTIQNSYFSAGIGRTGVFCAVHSITAKLKLLLTASVPQATISLKEIVLKMRDERAGMVQTMEQYSFIYQSLLEKLKEILKILEYKNER